MSAMDVVVALAIIVFVVGGFIALGRMGKRSSGSSSGTRAPSGTAPRSGGGGTENKEI